MLDKLNQENKNFVKKYSLEEGDKIKIQFNKTYEICDGIPVNSFVTSDSDYTQTTLAKDIDDNLIVDLLPWKPKCGEQYYCLMLHEPNTKYFTAHWHGTHIEEYYHSKNMIFKTKEEAVSTYDEIISLLKEWNIIMLHPNS